jgi:tRNA pseudouridine38-40 synthase
MTRRLRLVVAYDGGPFSGWQSQPNRNGIQDHLEAAVRKVSGQNVRVHGAGRTDAGVHAIGQCAHVDLANAKFIAEKWREALNASLPPTIRVRRSRYVSARFHARFSARAKIYRYRIWTGRVLSPFEYGRVWHVTGSLDFDRMSEAAKCFVGKHDFKVFAANRGKPEASTTRTLSRVVVQHRGDLLFVTLEGDGFLYKMARLIAGCLVACGRGKISRDQVERMLREGARYSGWGAAPASGLILERVRY